MNKPSVDIAKYIGAPIDANLPVPVELVDICNVSTAEPGEEMKTLTPDDGNGVDTIYTANANGTITTVKVVLGTPTTLTFAHLQSKLEYVLVSEILDSPDQSALGRRKAAMSRSMDKIEVKRVLDMILAVASQEVTLDSGEDIFDLVCKLIRKVENFGTDYILLAGTTAMADIDDYDKANANEFNYRIGIKEEFANRGIKKIVKVVGNIKLDGGSDAPILAAGKLILVARNSNLAAGKPIEFVRRKVSGIVGEAGGEATPEERALYVADTPSVLYNGNSVTHGYGVFGYESIIQAVLNYRALAWATYA